jgi:hypothetical protein
LLRFEQIKKRSTSKSLPGGRITERQGNAREDNVVLAEGVAGEDFHSELFAPVFAPVVGAVLPPTILSQVPTGT